MKSSNLIINKVRKKIVYSKLQKILFFKFNYGFFAYGNNLKSSEYFNLQKYFSVFGLSIFKLNKKIFSTVVNNFEIVNLIKGNVFGANSNSLNSLVKFPFLNVYKQANNRFIMFSVKFLNNFCSLLFFYKELYTKCVRISNYNYKFFLMAKPYNFHLNIFILLKLMFYRSSF